MAPDRSLRRVLSPAEGQATPLMAVGLVLAALAALALVREGGVVIDAARARTAADAAALAGAADGPEAAAALARANGGEILAVEVTGSDAVVRVRVGEAVAEARARRDGEWCRREDFATGAISYTRPPCRSSPG